MKTLRFLKYLILIGGLLFLAAKCSAQSPKVPQKVNTYYDFWGSQDDSIHQVPRVAPQARYRDTGMLYFNRSDHNFYGTVDAAGTVKCLSCPSSATPGLPQNGVQFNRNGIFTASDSLLFNKGLIFKSVFQSSMTANDFYGEIFNGQDTNGGLYWKYIPKKPDWGNFYQGTVLYSNINDGQLTNNDDQIFSLGPQWNSRGDGAKISDTLPAAGWRLETNFDSRLNHASYDEIHLTQDPVHTASYMGERRLLSFQCTNGKWSGGDGHLDSLNDVELDIMAKEINFWYNDTAGQTTTSPVGYGFGSREGFRWWNNINIEHGSVGQLMYSINGDDFARISDKQTGLCPTCDITLGAPLQRVEVKDTLEIRGSNGGDPVTFRTDSQPMNQFATHFDFVQTTTNNVPEEIDNLTFVKFTNDAINSTQGMEFCRAPSINVANMFNQLERKHRGWNIYDSTTNINYFWNGDQPVGGSSGYDYFTPGEGATIQLRANRYSVIDPAAPLASLTINFPGPFDGNFVELKFTKSVGALSYSNGTFSGGLPTTAVQGYLKIMYLKINDEWY